MKILDEKILNIEECIKIKWNVLMWNQNFCLFFFLIIFKDFNDNTYFYTFKIQLKFRTKILDYADVLMFEKCQLSFFFKPKHTLESYRNISTKSRIRQVSFKKIKKASSKQK